MKTIGIKVSEMEAITQEFRDMVATGVSKTIALDQICSKHAQYNVVFLRLHFRGAWGWNY